MKIIHCSDIHLDSRMERHLTAQQARERNAEICATFARMVTYAREEGAAVVLIAGDLFDTERVSPQTAGFVLEQVRKAEGIDFLYLRGNHDESRNVFSGMEIPGNFKAFQSGWTSYRYGSIVITGLELSRENCLGMYDTLSLNAEDTNIVMLHGQISTQPGEELIALPKLRGKHIQYLALGHLHSYQLDALDLDGVFCYPGCPEGRGFDECGDKGFVVLDISEGTVQTRFVPFATRRLHDLPVDISELTTVTELLASLEQACAGIPACDLVKFTLRGTFTPETQKDLRFLTKMLESRFYFVKIKDESQLRIDRESYEHDASLKGEFIRMVMASDRSDEEKEQIILCGIRALSGEEVAL